MIYNTILSIHMTFFDEDAKDFLCHEIKENINKFNKLIDNTYGDQADKHRGGLKEEENFVSMLEATSTIEFDVVLEIDVEKPNRIKYIVLYNDDPLFVNKMHVNLFDISRFYYNPYKSLYDKGIYRGIIYDIMYHLEFIPFNQKELITGINKPIVDVVLKEYMPTTVRCKRNILDEKKYRSIKKLLQKEEIDNE